MIAFVMFLVVVGSIVFHLLSPWWWTPIAWLGLVLLVRIASDCCQPKGGEVG